jgi:hypothetical protein
MPFLVLAMEGAFRGLDRRLEDAARTLGASRTRVFRQVTLPAIRPSLIAGAVLCWARALGEFGATLMFAGNLTGRTQTLPLAIYSALESDLRAAQALSLILVAVAFVLLLIVRRASAAQAREREARPLAREAAPDLRALRKDADQPQGIVERLRLSVDENRSGQIDHDTIVLHSEGAARDGITMHGNQPVEDYVSYTGLGHARLLSGALQMGTFVLCKSGQDALNVVLSNGGRARIDKTKNRCP